MLTDVRHVPTMFRNLISLSTLDNLGYKYFASGGVLKVSKGSLVVMKGVMKSANLYILSGDTIIGTAAISSAVVVTSENCSDHKLWHMRLGHMSQLGLTELSKGGLLKGYNNNELEFCEHCVFGKHKRVKFNTSIHTTEGILGYVHADLWGPSRKHSLGGCRYMLTIIDDYSKRVFPYFLKHKHEAFDAFKAWKVMVKKQTKRKVKVLRTDNDMEFCSNEFKFFCRKEGIVRHHTIPHTPQQNGVAERMNMTIISKARCMLSNASMGRQFWAEAASIACYLINMSPSTTTEKKTPMEVWSGSPSDYSQLKVFCCTTYAHVNNSKLEHRAAKCVILGYSSGVKGYKLWNPKIKKSMLSRSVVFNESEMYYSNRATNAHDDVPQKVSVQVENLDEGDHVIDYDAGTQDTHVLDTDSPAIVNSPILQPT
jgi:transposase InsO family protein